jgi:opacity protein-like surface antigen
LRRTALLALTFFTLFGTEAQKACAQASEPTPQTTVLAARTSKFAPSTDLAIGFNGELTDGRTVTTTKNTQSGTELNQVTQDATPAVGGFAAFHQSFTRWLGYNVHFGYTRFSEQWSNGWQFIPNSTTTLPASSSFAAGPLRTSVYDLSVASVIEGPRTRRFNTFAQVGGGGLFFNPANNQVGATQQIRPTLVFGVGANFKITAHLAFRAEYRGLFYKSPDFNDSAIVPGVTSASGLPITRLFTVTNTPALSLVYHFGRTTAASTRPSAVTTHTDDR